MSDPYVTAAQKYNPRGRTHVLFVAESPPRAIDRYFYFEGVERDDWLWIGLMKVLYRSDWERERTATQRQRKKDWLLRFQKSGFRLIDAVKQPICGNRRERITRIKLDAAELIREIKRIGPEQIVLIKATVHQALYQELLNANLSVVNDHPLPFPAAGWQVRFEHEFHRMETVGKLLHNN